MEVTAPFLVDAREQTEGGWVGRVRVDGHVLMLSAACPSERLAVEQARAGLAEHLTMLFTGATDVSHQQQTERYDSLVELEAGRLLRQAGGWSLVMVRAHEDHYVAVFQREWQD